MTQTQTTIDLPTARHRAARGMAYIGAKAAEQDWVAGGLADEPEWDMPGIRNLAAEYDIDYSGDWEAAEEFRAGYREQAAKLRALDAEEYRDEHEGSDQ